MKSVGVHMVFNLICLIKDKTALCSVHFKLTMNDHGRFHWIVPVDHFWRDILIVIGHVVFILQLINHNDILLENVSLIYIESLDWQLPKVRPKHLDRHLVAGRSI